jgi:O-antigen ligase
MNRLADEKFIRRYLPFFIVAISIAITPKVILDPINVPKMILLVISSFVCFAVLIPHLGYYFKRFKLLIVVISLYILDLFVILIFSSQISAQQIYGTFGRNTGLLFYLALALILLVGAFVSNSQIVDRIVWFLILTGLLSSIYGILQFNKIDPAGFESLYSSTIGFLGNPNFFSAFQGLALITSLAMVFSKGISSTKRISLALISVLSLISLYLAGAFQGFLVVLIGLTALTFFIAWNKNRVIGKAIFATSILGLLLIAIGLINKGPLGPIIYKSSLQARGYYWDAAWTMTKDHPIFGVGLDNFMFWYRRSRSSEATNWNPGVDTNSAHNVFLDYSSTGGVPFFLLNLILCVMVAASIVNRLKNPTGEDINFYILASVWIAFLAQSLISINQIGLSIWGWIIAGLIIGYQKNAGTDSPETSAPTPKGKKGGQQSSAAVVPPATVLRLVGAFTVGLLVCLPLWSSAFSYRVALETGKVETIEKAAYLRPYDLVRMVQSARILNENKFPIQALKISEDAVKAFPDSYIAWENLLRCEGLSPTRKAEVSYQLNRLDPFNPAHKLG